MIAAYSILSQVYGLHDTRVAQKNRAFRTNWATILNSHMQLVGTGVTERWTYTNCSNLACRINGSDADLGSRRVIHI